MEPIPEGNNNTPEDVQSPESEFVCKLTCQLFRVTTNKDGGGRVQFDFGLESLEDIQKIQQWNGQGERNFTIAVVPTSLMERCNQ